MWQIRFIQEIFFLEIRKMLKVYKKIFLIIFSCCVLGELIMRWCGFCDAPLYYNDPACGYSLVPNQQLTRFGNKYMTNEYGMRSDSLGDNEFRILFVGDSVLNGGTQTDQSKLASQMLDEKYRQNDIRVLNISCGGWGVDNEAGFFRKFGVLEGKLIVLLVNSHDAVGTISPTPIAGNSKNFPETQYSLAWIELFDRYIIPKVKGKIGIKDTINDTNTSIGNEHSEGWKYFICLSQDYNIPLVIYLHAEESEMKNGKYNNNGQWILQYAKQHNVPVIQDLSVIKETDYRDGIHLKENGQHVIFDLLDPVIDDFLKNKGVN